MSYILTPKRIRYCFKIKVELFQIVFNLLLTTLFDGRKNSDTIVTHSIKSNTIKNEQKSNLNLQKHEIRAYKYGKNIKKPLIHEKKKKRHRKKYYTIISIVLALL